jgi:hypothetical protein
MASGALCPVLTEGLAHTKRCNDNELRAKEIQLVALARKHKVALRSSRVVYDQVTDL